VKHARQSAVLELIQKRGYAHHSEIAKEFGISTATSRRDIQELAGLGLVLARHGGAISLAAQHPNRARGRDGDGSSESIAVKAAEYVLPGMSVGILPGVHALDVARLLSATENVSYVTNSIPVARLLGNVSRMGRERPEVILTPGVIDSDGNLMGDLCIKALSELSIDIAFVEVRSFDPRRSVFTDGLEEVRVIRAFRSSSRRLIGLFDSHVPDRSTLAIVDGIAPGDTLICNLRVPQLTRDSLAAAKYELVVTR
jgi:DeoR family transcriptional regulator of aga operon